MTFEQWRQFAQVTHARADRVSAAIVLRARQTAYSAGLDGSMPFLHAHNAMCGLHYGKPWPEVNYSLCRRVLWLERKSWEPSRLAERIIARAWATVK